MDALVIGGIAWTVGAIAVGVVAEFRGRMAPPWFLISMALSPLLGAVLLIAMPQKRRGSAVAVTADPDLSKDHTRCPECREVVRRDARKCKHCGSQLIPQ